MNVRGSIYRISVAFFVIVAQAVPAAAQVGSSRALERNVSEAVQNEDWHAAMDFIVKELAVKPKSREGMKQLRQIAPQFYSHHKATIEAAMKNAKTDTVRQLCEEILDISSRTTSLNLQPKKKDGPIPVAGEELLGLCEASLEEAARTHYTNGLNFMSANAFRDAAVEFRYAYTVQPGYEDSTQLYEECRQKALQRIAIIAEPSSSAENAPYVTRLKEACERKFPGLAGSPDGFEFLELLTESETKQRAAAAGVSLSSAQDLPSVRSTLRGVGGIDHLLVLGIDQATYQDLPETTDQQSWKGNVVVLAFEGGSLIPTPQTQYAEAVVTFRTNANKVSINATAELLPIDEGQPHVIRANGEATGISKSATFVGNKQAANRVPGAEELLDEKGSGKPLPSAGELTADALRQVEERLLAELEIYLASM